MKNVFKTLAVILTLFSLFGRLRFEGAAFISRQPIKNRAAAADEKSIRNAVHDAR